MNPNRQRVIPKNGLIVFNPENKTNLPPEGANVIIDNYWNRAIMDNEVEVIASMHNQKVLDDALNQGQNNIDDKSETSNNQGGRKARGK